ncbi:MAG TPA: beta-galactosidase GalB [Verrucomicrobiae bacterium]|nr:beta-galactosidase GalB [Verrucomicrobiae bacterium]
MKDTIKLLTVAALILGQELLSGALPIQATPRERISINDHWRFTKGDPNGDSTGLIYDVRPEVKDKKDDKAADTEPTEAEKIAATNRFVLKRWILPTGNAFIKDPAMRHACPDANAATNVSYTQPGFDDRSWQSVNLPHDWAIEGPFYTGWGNGVGGGMGRLPSPGIGWYRKQLDIPASDAGKSIFLDVDGAMSYAMVWLNGHLVGGWPYGYASWRVDLTPYVVPGGENLLSIRLDNPPDSSRWYPGGGIYRNVWLTKTFSVHVGQWGTQLTTPEVSRECATVNLKITVDNDSKQPANVSVATEIFLLDIKGKQTGTAVAKIAPVSLQIQPGQSAVVEGNGNVANPRLWGPPPTQQPNRYVAVTTVAASRQSTAILPSEDLRRSAEMPLHTILDVYETRFGIRDVRFDPDKGLFVNGERIPLRGVNQHHDLGALGAAFNVRAAQRQLEELREMGCNAVRMSHNPPAPELLELCDQMGFLVIDEIFDCWERKKTPLDFHLIFPDWSEPDLRALIRRDRNHPSVFIWSVGNEVGEQYTGEAGAKVAQRLSDIAHDEDLTRRTTTAMNYAKPNMPLPTVVDVIGLNYQGEGIRDALPTNEVKGIRTPPQYPAFHAAFTNKVIVSTESAAALSSRGEYLFPIFNGLSAPVKNGSGGDSKRQQVSAYELYAADFGSSADKVFAAQDRHPFVAGEFVWSGWDYLGEPTPYYGARSSYFGIIDLAGFKKDRFYLYQSRWRPDFPMAHILPHWTWPERVGQLTPVHVFTSGDEAELFLNDKSLGRKKKGEFEYRLRWDDVVYQPGTLKVVAYKNGKVWATDEVKTAGELTKLKLKPDRDTISADGNDLAFITVTMTDQHGVTAPRADNRIHFEIEGPGEIIATDNGDPTSFESFQAHDREAFNGLCLVIVRGKAGQRGTIKLTAKADGLKAGMTSVKTIFKKN